MTEVRLGDKRIPFIYQGDELIHPAPVKDGLILWYDFSAMSNTSATASSAQDLSGNGNHAVLNNFDYTSASGYVGGGLRFDGYDDFIGYQHSFNGYMVADEALKHAHTLSFIFKIHEDKRNNMLYASEELKIDVFGDYMRRRDNGFDALTSVNFLNQPRHVCMTFDGSILRTYIDGELKTESTSSLTTEEMNFPGVSNIGSYVPNGRPNMTFYDLKVYNRSLTTQEIAHNYAIEKERFGIE